MATKKRSRTATAGTGADGGDGRGASRETAKDVRLGEGLRAAMGGRRFCKEGELTRDVLLSYLKAEGQVMEVELMEVVVQAADGTQLQLTMERRSRVREVKAGIERVWGMPRHRQDLFILDDNSEESCGACDPLPGDTEVSGGYPFVLLCARESGEWFEIPYGLINHFYVLCTVFWLLYFCVLLPPFGSCMFTLSSLDMGRFIVSGKGTHFNIFLHCFYDAPFRLCFLLTLVCARTMYRTSSGS